MLSYLTEHELAAQMYLTQHCMGSSSVLGCASRFLGETAVLLKQLYQQEGKT